MLANKDGTTACFTVHGCQPRVTGERGSVIFPADPQPSSVQNPTHKGALGVETGRESKAEESSKLITS